MIFAGRSLQIAEMIFQTYSDTAFILFRHPLKINKNCIFCNIKSKKSYILWKNKRYTKNKSYVKKTAKGHWAYKKIESRKGVKL